MGSNRDRNEFSCSCPRRHKPQAASERLSQRCCCRSSFTVKSQSGHLLIYFLSHDSRELAKGLENTPFQVHLKGTSYTDCALPSRLLFLSSLAVCERDPGVIWTRLNSNSSCRPLPLVTCRPHSASAALGCSRVRDRAARSQHLLLCF